MKKCTIAILIWCELNYVGLNTALYKCYESIYISVGVCDWDAIWEIIGILTSLSEVGETPLPK